MKICILSIVNIKHMTASSLYTDYFDETSVKYDLIYIDKYSIEEKSSAENLYRFKLSIKQSWSRKRKVVEYFKFRKFAKRILIENDYDLIITWGTETAYLFSDILYLRYPNKFIINIRDYANVSNPIKKQILKFLVKRSKFTTISSKGFETFLPKNNYLLIHSINQNILNNASKRNSLRMKNETLRICFVGNVRFYENDKKLLNALGNDERFIIQYFGVGSDYLRDYANSNKIKNVEFVPSFDVSETPFLLNRADIINNLYGYNDISLDTAVSIKYYHAIYLRLPILVYKNTFMEKISNDIAYSFDDNYTDLGDRLYKWYHNIDFDRFMKHCDDRLDVVYRENKEFYYQLSFILKSVRK